MNSNSFIHGQIVFKEGQEVNGLWLIISGEFEVQKTLAYKKYSDMTGQLKPVTSNNSKKGIETIDQSKGRHFI